MRTQTYLLVVFFLMLYSGCKTSTQPDNNDASSNKNILLTTDSLAYVRSSGSAAILFQIHNRTDSTVVFPSCGQVNCRIDTMEANSWSKGTPSWNSPCLAIFLTFSAIKSDSTYVGYLVIKSSGTFKIATIYGSSPSSYPDTVLSNSFTVK